MAALDWLQQRLGGGQYGDPSTPAMPTQPLPDDALARLRAKLGQGAASSLYAGGGDAQPGLNMLGRAVVAPALAGGAALEATMTGQPVSAAEMLQAAMMGITPTPTRLPGGVPSATPTTMERLWADETGGIRAFHGSPHSFDRFDLSKIGTGEGAQAYGHGLYFAENEGVARGYRDTLATGHVRAPGSELNLADDPLLGKAARHLYNANGDYALAAERVRKLAPDAEPALQKLREMNASPWPGHMYEVDINADPKAFLDWDKALTEQSPQVQDALAALRDKLSGMSLDLRPGQVPIGRDAYHRLSVGGNPDAPGTAFSARPDLATQQLREVGVPGIRYLDQGSRGAGEGTHNFAVGDDSLIQILRKYGIIPPVAAGGGLLATGSEPPI